MSVSDPRFAAVHNDPRFARNVEKKTKVKKDDRFSAMFTDPDFNKEIVTKVDKYGRKNVPSKPSSEFDSSDSDSESSSSSSSDEKLASSKGSTKTESNKKQPKGKDSDRMEKLNRMARGEGNDSDYSSSSSSSDADDSDSDTSSSDEDDAEYSGHEEYNENLGHVEYIPTGEETNRIALVNMDWEHVKAVDIYALLQSFVSGPGAIMNVSVYPSTFGLERMALESSIGPVGLFQKSKSVADESGPTQGSSELGGDLDVEKVRQYEKDKLKYYYAVITCESTKTGIAVYNECDGMEYETSSNVLDLRFVPNDTKFERKPRDTADTIPRNYKPPAWFATKALQQSNVKLSWDGSDDERDDRLKNWRHSTDDKSSKKLAKEEDLRMYLAGVSDDSDAEDSKQYSAKLPAGDREDAKKMRMLLGLGNESSEDEEEDGDVPAGFDAKDLDSSDNDEVLEITFTPGLGENLLKKKRQKEMQKGETVFEKYQREKKNKRKERQRLKKRGRDGDSSSTNASAHHGNTGGLSRDKHSKDNAGSLRREVASKEELELLMKSDSLEKGSNSGLKSQQLEDYDFNQIVKAEKRRKKRRKGKKGKAESEIVDTFEVNTTDPRFSAMYDDSSFAIDPTHPKFRDTRSMKKILAEKDKKRGFN
jgi:hypothetical protein